jgi:hypothetical protein
VVLMLVVNDLNIINNCEVVVEVIARTSTGDEWPASNLQFYELM